MKFLGAPAHPAQVCLPRLLDGADSGRHAAMSLGAEAPERRCRDWPSCRQYQPCAVDLAGSQVRHGIGEIERQLQNLLGAAASRRDNAARLIETAREGVAAIESFNLKTAV